MRAPRISDGAARERQLRVDAASEAAALFASHGSHAIEILSARLVDQSRSNEQRRGDRLALLEVERLDRTRRRGPAAGAIVVWRPAMFSRAWFAGLFRRRPRRR